MSFKELTAWHQGRVARMPAPSPSPSQHWCSHQALIGQLSPDCRASSTFQSGVGGMWVMEGWSVSMVAVRLGTRA